MHRTDAILLKTHPEAGRAAVGVERVDMRIVLVAVSTAFYAVTFSPLFATLGPGVVSLAAVPVALAGWLFGLRWGLAAGGVAFPMNAALLLAAGPDRVSAALWGGAVAGSAALLVGAVAGTLRDVTDQLSTELEDRRTAERELRASEERLRHLVESAPGTLLAVARDGTVLFSSHEIGGVAADEARDTSVYDYVPRKHHDLFRGVLAGVFDTGHPNGYEAGEAGEVMHVIRFGPVMANARVEAVTVLSLDVAPGPVRGKEDDR